MLLTTERPTAAEHEARALIEEARRNQHRRWRRAFSALGAIFLVLGAVAVVVTHRSNSHLTGRQRTKQQTGVPAPGRPEEIVGWALGGPHSETLVVISTRTGAVVRVLVPHLNVSEPGSPDISVSPTGMVFFDGAGLSTSHAGVADQIFSVRITGGSITRVAAGMDPQLSPDGRMLAYVASDPLGEAPYLARTGGVEIGEVHGGGISDVRALRPGQEQLGLGLSQLSWSPDSHNLAFDLYDGSTNATTFWRLAISNHVTSLALAQEIRLHQPGLTWNGYLGHDQNGRAIGLGVLTSASGAQQLVTVNPVTGGVVRTLFGVPGAVCVPATPASSPRCADPFNDAVSSDSSGRDLLVAGVIPPKGVAATTLSSQDLYRWSAGDRAPLRLTTDVALAAWGPDSAG